MELMVDLETMGNSSRAAIVQIGAVAFDLEGDGWAGEFNSFVNLWACKYHGLEIDPDTVMWWLQQSQEARDNITKNKNIGLRDALNKLKEFAREQDVKYYWSHGATFDLVILQEAFKSVKLRPWRYPFLMDTRTLLRRAGGKDAISEEYKQKIDALEGTTHDALHDCKVQVYQIQWAWKMTGGKS